MTNPNGIPSPFNPDPLLQVCPECGEYLNFMGIVEEDGEPYELHECPCRETKTLNTYIQDDGTDYPYEEDIDPLGGMGGLCV